MTSAACFNRSIILAAAIALALPAAAGAQAPPHRKTGMWETTMLMPGGRTMVTSMCTDAATEARYSAFRPQGPQACKTLNNHPIPGGFAMESECVIGGRTTHSSMTVTGDFQSAYKMEVVGEGAKATPTKVTMNARWTGPCPAGRKPGDMVMPGGMVINIASLPGG